MKRALALLLAVVGCGDDYAPVDDDSSVDDDASADTDDIVLAPDVMPIGDTCDPITQEPCTLAEKCTWIVDSSMPATGHIGCPFSGTIAIGQPCDRSANGVPDACERGAYCDDVCRQICDRTGAEPVCDEGQTCEMLPGELAWDEPTVAGVCR